jgi:hypothetical protein
MSNQVVDTIFEQLGGNKFLAMTGSKNLIMDGNNLHMTLVKNISKAKHLTITLTEKDTYNLRFFNITGGKLNLKTYEFSEIKQVDVQLIEDIQVDQLQEIFTEVTGMDTHL